MTRYIDADLLLEEVENNTPLNFSDSERELAEQFDFKVFKHIIEYQPTADVVPKSEVENLIYKLECLLCHSTGGMLSKYSYDLQTMESVVTDYINKVYYEGYDEAKAEVAREIFEEIEEMLISSSLLLDCTMLIDTEMLAELKKKYTEGEPNESKN
jgi:hypothetical protein